jgi:hypothetical protein
MSRSDPPVSQGHRTVVYRVNPELLEALDPRHDVDYGIHRPHLVQLYLIGRQSVNPPFGLS